MGCQGNSTCGCGCQDGDRGPIGPRGEKGDTGATGEQGIQGIQGEQGVQGDVGPQGDVGADGPQGADGNVTPGPTGPQGNPGPIGLTGPPGNDGDDGDDGLDGANGQGRINYYVDSTVGAHVENVPANSGVFMKNVGGIATVQLPTGTINASDKVQVVGTSIGTGGWKIKAGPTEKIQLTSQLPSAHETVLGGEVVIDSTNYRDVITMIYDGIDSWIIINKIFANGVIPTFL